MRRRESLMLLAGAALPVRLFGAKYAPAVADWNRPVEPFRIVGNLYYVGVADVSVFLFATPEGNLLVDTAFRESVPIVEANIRKLGFRPEDTRFILASHAHYDHIAGAAEWKRRTKARLVANPAELPMFRRGGLRDFAFGDKYAFEPVAPDVDAQEGKPVVLGKTAVTPYFTPGHTKGCTTWTARVEESGHTYDVLIAGSLSCPGYRLVDNPEYPDIARDFESSFAKMRALPCDVFLSMHSWDFDFHNRRAALAKDQTRNPFLDATPRDAYVNRMRAAFLERYQQQRAAKASGS